jgi:hypothetical protein
MVGRARHDRRWNKVWYFFMLVAAGLILSWGQVGQRYKQKENIDTREYLLLRTEDDCNLSTAPCAAYAPDFAMVVNLKDNKDWYTIEVKTVGEKLSLESIVRMSFEPESSLYETEVLPVRFKEPDGWVSFVQLPDNSDTVWRLRVSVERGNKVMVADFSLPGFG